MYQGFGSCSQYNRNSVQVIDKHMKLSNIFMIRNNILKQMKK